MAQALSFVPQFAFLNYYAFLVGWWRGITKVKPSKTIKKILIKVLNRKKNRKKLLKKYLFS
jgi:hypothetical protein